MMIICMLAIWIAQTGAGTFHQFQRYGNDPASFSERPYDTLSQSTNKPDSAARWVNTIRNIQRQANGKRYGNADERIVLYLADDNFSSIEDSTFAYRLTYSRPGQLPFDVNERLDLFRVTSIKPLPVSTDRVGAVAVCFAAGNGTTVLNFYYVDKGTTGGKLMNALLDLIHYACKRKGLNLDELYADFDSLMQASGDYASISAFIDKYPNSILTDFAKLLRTTKEGHYDTGK